VPGFLPLALLAACAPYPTSPPPLLWFRAANLTTLRPAGLLCSSEFHFGRELPKFQLDVLAVTGVPLLASWSRGWRFVFGLAPRCQGLRFWFEFVTYYTFVIICSSCYFHLCIFWLLLKLLSFIIPRVPKKMYTHFKRCYLCITFRS
jgi:hypothetical protein